MHYIIAFLAIFVNSVIAMDTQLDPKRVSIQASNTSIALNGQNLAVHYLMYDGQIILKISDNLVPIFNSMIIKLKNDNNMFIYDISKADKIIFEAQQLKEVLIVPEIAGKFVDIKTRDIKLLKKSLPKSYSLKVNINQTRREYEIPRFAYKQMKNTILVAKNQNQSIRINLDFFPLIANFSDKKGLDTNFKAIPDRKQRD